MEAIYIYSSERIDRTINSFFRIVSETEFKAMVVQIEKEIISEDKYSSKVRIKDIEAGSPFMVTKRKGYWTKGNTAYFTADIDSIYIDTTGYTGT